MKKIIFCFLLCYICSFVYATNNHDLNIIFVGDVMLDDKPGELIKRGIDPFANVATLFNNSDISIGNLECVVGTTGKVDKDKPYSFRANPRVIPLLKKYFSAISLANNHSVDYGITAFSQMLDLFDKHGLAYFGAGRNINAANEPIMFNVKGKKIAILSFDFFMPRSYEALDDRPGVAWGDEDNAIFDIKAARLKHHADIVIVYPHWGIEYRKIADKHQIDIAHKMIDAGADAVVGGHPHVTQNVEVYKNKPIFYSLGNFVFSGFDEKEAKTGWLLELSFSKNLKEHWVIHVVELDNNGVPKEV